MEVDFLILADAAQAVGGKLYMLGGGWEVLTVTSPLPARHPFAIALGLSVPWNETNQRHNVTIEIQDEDGNEAATLRGQLEVGRPAGLPQGSSQRVVLAMNGSLSIERAGQFAVLAKIEDSEAKRVSFRVLTYSA